MSEPKNTSVVTGAAAGIGAGICEQLIADGWRVVGVDIDEDALQQTARRCGPDFIPFVGDVSDWATHEQAAHVASGAGALRGWVNNAGVDVHGFAHDVTAAQITDGLRVNQLGTMFGTAVAVRSLLPAAAGVIINISSIQAITAYPGYFAYQAAKAAVVAISRGVGVDYAERGIRCIAVLPGNVLTPMSEASLPVSGPERERELAAQAKRIPLGRIGSPGDIAATVGWLMSDAASWMTACSVVIDGGVTGRAEIVS